MTEMTSYERMKNALDLKPVDRVPYCDGPWDTTIKRWISEGHLVEGEDIAEHFKMDHRGTWAISSLADLDFEPVVIEETEETILQLDGNGAKLRRHKLHNTTPEHVDFTVKDRTAWEEKIKPHLVDVNRKRINFEVYRTSKKIAADNQRFFTWSGVAPFEQMHPVTGHEYMLMGMALDPDWIRDMVMTYAQMTINHLEVLFSEEGMPDGMFFYEDMGFKNKPFMSPEMYREIIQPGHKLLFDFCHSKDLKVIVHSCGFVKPLVPGLIEAGMDCLQAMEVKAGMDMREIKKEVGNVIAFFGNIDIRTLATNDKKIIDKELEEKIPPMLDGGYILHSDHSIPPEVDYETLWYFFERGCEISARGK